MKFVGVLGGRKTAKFRKILHPNEDIKRFASMSRTPNASSDECVLCEMLCVMRLSGWRSSNNNECKIAYIFYDFLLADAFSFRFSQHLCAIFSLALRTHYHTKCVLFFCSARVSRFVSFNLKGWFTIRSMTFGMTAMAPCLHIQWHSTLSLSISLSRSISKIEFYCCFMWIHIQTINIAYLCSTYTHPV